MRKQAGFLGIGLYVAIAASVAFLGMGAALKWQSSRLASCKQEFVEFQAAVKAAADAQAAIDAKNKEKADAERKKMLAANATLNRRLRDSASASSLPPASPAGVADRACFDRASLDLAIRQFTQGTAAIAIDGQQAVDELSNARSWAQGR